MYDITMTKGQGFDYIYEVNTRNLAVCYEMLLFPIDVR